jgi:glycosyltransferase involved in cell wall biosynthesis
MFSLVIPVYRNEETIPLLMERIGELSDRLSGPLEVVFVVDGSPDTSLQILRSALPGALFSSKLIALSRNFGSFAAIRQGLEASSGAYCAVMAADLQEPIELVEQFFERLSTGEVDVVVGERTGRADPVLSAASARVFWWAYRRLIQPEVPAGGVDVFGCSRMVCDALLGLRESNSSLVGLLFWLGFRREAIPYERMPREHGRSAWTLRRKTRYLLDSAFAFTDLPITALLSVGGVGVVLSVLLAIVVLTLWVAGRIPVLGYTPIVLLLLFSLSVILFALGIVGSYIWRTFENSKQRPLYVPLSIETFEGDANR